MKYVLLSLVTWNYAGSVSCITAHLFPMVSPDQLIMQFICFPVLSICNHLQNALKNFQPFVSQKLPVVFPSKESCCSISE